MQQSLESRWTTLSIAIATSAFFWWAWGGTFHPLPLVHDEVAYLLQAQLFARGRWIASAAPLPEFFEQFHVLVTPVVAAKYPPGHSLLLVPGIWLGFPALVPLLLSGVAGALLFTLSRRFVNASVALLTWAFWIGASGNLLWRSSYYSEVTTSALGLAAWWGLLRWRQGGSRWLLLVAACIGWGAITRPLTMLAFAMPVAWVVLRTATTQGRWREIAWAAAVGLLVLGIVPLWSVRTTGDWRKTPLTLYRQMYMPWDRLGFGLDTTPGTRALPGDMEPVAAEFRGVHARYTVAAAPRQLARRALEIAFASWNARRLPLALLALAGLLFLPAEAVIAVATSILLFLGYAAYAHKPGWALYYFEILPVTAFLTAMGLWGVSRFLLREGSGATGGPGSRWRGQALALFLVPFVLGFAIKDGRSIRHWRVRQAAGQLALRRTLESVGQAKAIVFVRYAPDHPIHDSYVTNEPPLDRERIWLVHDLGARNSELIRWAADRTPYVYDEATQQLTRLPR